MCHYVLEEAIVQQREGGNIREESRDERERERDEEREIRQNSAMSGKYAVVQSIYSGTRKQCFYIRNAIKLFLKAPAMTGNELNNYP